MTDKTHEISLQEEYIPNLDGLHEMVNISGNQDNSIKKCQIFHFYVT